MVNLLRKYQQALMIAVTVVVIISFVWLYNSTQFDKIGHDSVAIVYGRTLRQGDVNRYQNQLQLAYQLQMFDYLQLTGAFGQNALENFIFNQIVAKHEAKALQVAASGDEVYETIRALPVFQTGEAFDSRKFEAFIQQSLGPRGFTEQQFDELIRDSIVLKKLKNLVSATIELSPTEFRIAYEQQFQKIEASIVRIKTADILPGIQVSDADIQKAYEQRKDTLKSEEKRQVQYVKFEMTAEQEKLTGAARTEVLQNLANRAQEFAQAMLAPGAKFEDTAVKFGTAAIQTDEFTAAEPPDEIKGVSDAAERIFLMTQEDPNSDAIQNDEESAFYLFHLMKVVPAGPLSFENAREQIAAKLKTEHAAEQLKTRGVELRAKIDEGMKAGKTFADAAKAAGAAAVKLSEFSLGEPPKDKSVSNAILAKSVELAEGQTSDFTEDADGGFLLHIDKRHPIDEAKFAADKPKLQETFSASRRQVAFLEWLRIAREAANITGVKGS